MELIDISEFDTAADVLWAMMLERTGDTDISFQMPTMAEHVAFVEDHPYRYWSFLYEDGEVLGSISLTERNEIGVQVFREHRRKGYARTAIEMAMEQWARADPEPSRVDGRWIANINPANEASIRLFESLGFRYIQATYARED